MFQKRINVYLWRHLRHETLAGICCQLPQYKTPVVRTFVSCIIHKIYIYDNIPLPYFSALTLPLRLTKLKIRALGGRSSQIVQLEGEVNAYYRHGAKSNHRLHVVRRQCALHQLHIYAIRTCRRWHPRRELQIRHITTSTIAPRTLLSHLFKHFSDVSQTHTSNPAYYPKFFTCPFSLTA